MRKIPFVLLVLFFSGCVSHQKAQPNTNKKRYVFHKPVAKGYVVTQVFRPKKNLKHNGIDLAGKKNSPIYAMAHGRVVYAGNKFSGYGKMILIDHGNGLSSLYSHLNKFFVSSGKRVKRGHIIGTMGRTGRATGVHLHFEVMEHKIPVNPRKYIPSL